MRPSRWRRWPSASSPRRTTFTKESKPSWRSAHRSSRVRESALPVGESLPSDRDDAFLGQIRGPDELAHPRPERRLDRGYGQPATVFCLIQTVEGKRPGQKGLARDRLFAGGKETCEAEDHERHGGIVDRDVDEFPAARTVSYPPGCQDRKGGVEAARQLAA